jgi:hypothetical protein
MRYFDKLLTEHPFVTGDMFTMPDITLFAGLARAVNLIPEGLPALMAWHDRVSGLPAIKNRTGTSRPKTLHGSVNRKGQGDGRRMRPIERFYRLAEADNLPSILQHGLVSTERLPSPVSVPEAKRATLLRRHPPDSVRLWYSVLIRWRR